MAYLFSEISKCIKSLLFARATAWVGNMMRYLFDDLNIFYFSISVAAPGTYPSTLA